VPVDVLVEVAGRLFRCLHCKFGLIICSQNVLPRPGLPEVTIRNKHLKGEARSQSSFFRQQQRTRKKCRS